jgi:hypothetical protein
MDLTELFKEEVGMLKKSPITLAVATVVLGALIFLAENATYREILARKDDLIQTLQKQLEAKSSKPQEPSAGGAPTGPAISHGDNSPANTGSGNTFSYPPKSDQKKPKKR